MDKHPKLKISELSVFYHNHLALEDINLELPLNGITGIVGPNGAGKSTFLKTLAGVIPFQKGSIYLDGISFSSFKPQIAYVPQKKEMNLDFPITVLEVVAQGSLAKKKWYQRINKLDLEKAKHHLNEMGLANIESKSIGDLSGGQQQRVFLARALMQDARVLLLDEPFSGLDVVSEEKLIEQLKKLASSGLSIMIVHHDLDSWKKFFDQLIILKRHLIACGDFKTACTSKHLSDAYGFDFKDFS